jgi:hypothetical protein
VPGTAWHDKVLKMHQGEAGVSLGEGEAGKCGVKGMKRKVVIDVESEDKEEEEDMLPLRKVARSKWSPFYFCRISLILYFCCRKF